MFKRIILILLLCGVLMAPAVAQEDTHTEALTEAPAPGLGTLTLLTGIIFVIGVGGEIWRRELMGVSDKDK